MRISHEIVEPQADAPVRHRARRIRGSIENVIVRIADNDGVEGFGEAAPNRYYGESVATVIAALGQFAPVLEGADRLSLEAIEASARTACCAATASAKSAISSALHDLVGQAARRSGSPAVGTRSLRGAAVELHHRDRRQRRARASGWRKPREYPILKVKLGHRSRHGDRPHRSRRGARTSGLRVDANAAWTAKQAVRMSDFLADQRGRDARAARRGARHRRTSLRARTIEAAGLRRRVVPRRDRRRRSSPARSTASTSSSRSAAACAKRCGWCTRRARSACR